MLRYKEYYLKYGNRKIADLLDPKVIMDTDIEYPLDTMLFWSKISDVINGPSYDYGVLTNIKYPLVVTPTEYDTNTLGKFTKRGNINPTKVIADLKKKAKGFKYYRPNTTNINLTSKKVLIFNYSPINVFYKYVQHPFNAYYKWWNAYSTMVNNLSSDKTGMGKNKFLFIDVPNILPDRIIIDKYVPNLTRQGLDKFITNRHFNILDLWRYLTPDYKEKSALSKIPVNDLKYITIVFTLNNKVTLVNLELLSSIVSEYGIKGKLSKYKAKTVRKVVYILLTKFIEKSTIPIDKLIDYHNDEDSDNIDDDTSVDDNTLDKTIDEDTSVPDVTVTDIVDSTDIDIAADEVDDVEADAKKPLNKKIATLADKKILSKNKAKQLTDTYDNNKNIKVNIPGKGKVEVKELLEYKKDDFVLTKEDGKLPDVPYTDDKDVKVDTIGAYDKKYITKVLDKDIFNTLYSVQNNNFIVKNIEVTSNKSIMGETLNYDIELLGLDGKPHKFNVILPKINEDGTFTVSSNRYTMRKQKTDLVIRKIDYNKVALTTYYGKLFITKATFKKDDAGFWLKKQMIKKYNEDDKLTNLVIISNIIPDVKLPTDYTLFSRYIKSFDYEGFSYFFNYEDRLKAFKLDAKDAAKIETKGKVIIAKKANSYILVDSNNKYYIYKDGTYKDYNNLYTILDIDKSKQPIEYSNIKIYKENIPLIILLSYYIKLDKVLAKLHTKYTKHKSNERIALEDNQFAIRFKDYKLIVERDYGVSDLLLGGLVSIKNAIKNINLEVFNNPKLFSVVYNELKLPIVYANEIKLLISMYIDPMSKTLLEEIHEPTDFVNLLFRANELLKDDSYKNPNDITNMVIKGYERMAGMLYSELVKSMKAHENKSVFGNSKLNVNPYSIINRINEDSTTVLVDDINPIAELKQSEDVTMIGAFGRGKVSMNRDTRIMHPSEIGIISEATKDSSDVGITAIMTANPNIESVRGIVRSYDNKIDNKSKTLSTTALLMPASNKDDVKRLTN